MSVARAIQPGQQTEMLPLFLLGGFGYPNYPGISETDGVSVFFFETDAADPAIVILGKVGQDSPLRQTVQSMNWVIEDRDGWLLLAQNADAFKSVTDLDALVAINAEKADFDVTGRFYLGKDKVKQWATTFKDMIAAEHVPASDDENKPLEIAKKQRYVDLAAQSIENLSWFEIGLDLSAETITIGSATEAVAGTPEGALLSSAAGGEIPVGKLISADGMMTYQSKVSVDALLAYSDVVIARASKMTGPAGKAWLKEYSQMMKEYAKDSDGSVAGSMTMDKELPQIAAVYGGSYTNEGLLKMGDTLYDKLIPELLANVSFFKDMGLDYKFTLNKNVGKVGDISVHEVVTSIKYDPATTPQVAAAAAKATEQDQISYFSVVNGMVLTTASMDHMKTLVADVQAGKPVTNNIASAFEPTSGAVAQYVIDIVDYAGIGLGAAAEAAPEMKEWADAMAKLKSENLSPAMGSVMIGNNRMKSSISLSVPSIAKVTQVMQQIQAQKVMEQMKQQQQKEQEDAASDSSEQM